MRILIADDEHELRDVLSSIIQMELDCDVIECDNGSSALKECQSSEFDLLVFDYRMPVMSGVEVYKALVQESNPNAKKCIVFLSGYIEEVTSQFQETEENLIFMSKPFDVPKFMNFINQLKVKHTETNDN